MTLPDDLNHLAEHLSDDHDGLPLHSKNTVLLAAKALRDLTELIEDMDAALSVRNKDVADIEIANRAIADVVQAAESLITPDKEQDDERR